MKDKAFIDTNVIVYAYSNDLNKKSGTLKLLIYSEDMQHGQIIEGTLKIVNPFII